MPNFTTQPEDQLHPAKVLSSTDNAFWRRKENNYWLYVEGKGIANRTTSVYSGNDLIVTDPETNKRYELSDYTNRADNQLRPARLKTY